MTTMAVDDQPVACLDQLNLAPDATVNPNVQNLSSQIAFVAPSNPFVWAYLTLGLHCSVSHQPAIPFPKTPIYMGFCIDEKPNQYICARDFKNPRLVELCDLHPQHNAFLDVTAGGLYIYKVQVLQDVGERLGSSNTLERTGYVLSSKSEDSSVHNWILVVFNATSVLQIIRNGWGKSSMEVLVRHLVRHGFEFRTFVSASDVKVNHPSCSNHPSPQLVNFTGIPPIPDIKIKRTVNDYAQYVSLRERLMEAPEARPAYRMGGILWRLAMESTANFDDIIDHIMDGPSIGPTKVEYFSINGKWFYDESIPSLVADTICGMHGDRGCSYWPSLASWAKRRWSSPTAVHSNLMWNDREEEWFRRRSDECMKASGPDCGQPIPQSYWKKFDPSKGIFDVPFEEYCKTYLESWLPVPS